MPQSETELVHRLALVGTHPHDKEATSIRTRLDTLTVRIDDANDAVTQLPRGFRDDAQDPLSEATPAIMQLGEILVQIPRTSGTKRRVLIAKAKVSAATVSTTLKGLIKLGETTIQSAELLKQRNSELEERAQQYLQRITELIQIADDWVKCAAELKTKRENAVSKHLRDGAGVKSRLPNGEFKAAMCEGGQQGGESEQKAISAIRDAQRKVTESNSQLAKFSRLKVHQETAAKSLQMLRTRLDNELAKVRDAVKDATDVSSFMVKLSAASFKVEGINEVLAVTGQIDRLKNEIGNSSSLTGPFFDDPHALLEGLRAISDAD